MKTLQIATGLAIFGCNWAAFGQVPVFQNTVQCGQMLNGQLLSGAVLTIDSRPAGIEIVGTDQEGIRVSCKTDDTYSATHTHLRLSGTPTQSKLTIDGEHLNHNNLQIRIEVPRKTNLRAQMPAGQVNVNEIVGDKDIELYAGQITITAAHKWDYKDVDVSVSVGQVNAKVYGEGRGGFFDSVRKQNADGEYRLHAHVTTGQIDLLGKSPHTSGPQ
jgi:hypothetical protein